MTDIRFTDAYPKDEEIIDLFFARDDSAVLKLENKYGKLFASIAESITGSRDDASECVNDTYLRIWNSVPPERPQSLKAYGGRIVRNVAINRVERETAAKRGGGEILLELDESVPDTERESEGEISRLIDSFLRRCDRESRVTFVLRYWYCVPLDEIARRTALSESAVKSRLFRTRKKLKSYLEKEGVSL